MVALKKYTRIEASGLWRAEPDAQRRDVIVTLGDASLTIKANNEQPLAHWSLAAVARLNPGERPARFSPDGDPGGEELELPENEAEMIDAIETLRKAVDRARPHPGRVRWIGFALSLALVAWVVLYWLPGALITHTQRVLPDVGKRDIGNALFARIQRVTGPACGTSAQSSALAALGARLDAPQLAVLPGGTHPALTLPGGRILLAHTLVEDHEDPAVAAGYILEEQVKGTDTNPLKDLLEFSGPFATFRLLTTGAMPQQTLDDYAEHLLTVARMAPPHDTLLKRFESAALRSAPYAYARDITGETVLPLIEADATRDGTTRPILADNNWLRLQAICGG